MNITNIKQIELGLSNKCMLKCPLCASRHYNAANDEILKSVELIFFLDKCINLEVIKLVGSLSEPTLYPDLFPLLEYLNSRNIKVVISTNGNLINNTFWITLGKLLKRQDEIYFAVDGSTQQIYCKYRVNGKLDRVLANADLLKKNTISRVIMQNIIFKHNQSDKQNMINLFLKTNFDFLLFVNCGEDSQFFSSEPIVKNIRSNIKKNQPFYPQCMWQQQVYVNHKGYIFNCSYSEFEYINDNLISNYNIKDDSFEFEYEFEYVSGACQYKCVNLNRKQRELLFNIGYDRSLNKYHLFDFVC